MAYQIFYFDEVELDIIEAKANLLIRLFADVLMFGLQNLFLSLVFQKTKISF